jgi:two-component system response regulator FixJ
MEQRPTIFIVDDSHALQDSLRDTLTTVGLRVQTFSHAQGFLDAYDPSMPGCLLTDVQMPGLTGPELQELLIRNEIEIPVIVMSAFGDIQLAVRTTRNGAIGFLEKPFTTRALLERINIALREDTLLRETAESRSEIQRQLSRLTKREREILDLVIRGKRSPAIAAELGITAKTIESHRSRIMTKLHVNTVAELVERVLRFELTAPTRGGSSPALDFGD